MLARCSVQWTLQCVRVRCFHLSARTQVDMPAWSLTDHVHLQQGQAVEAALHTPADGCPVVCQAMHVVGPCLCGLEIAALLALACLLACWALPCPPASCFCLGLTLLSGEASPAAGCKTSGCTFVDLGRPRLLGPAQHTHDNSPDGCAVPPLCLVSKDYMLHFKTSWSPACMQHATSPRACTSALALHNSVTTLIRDTTKTPCCFVDSHWPLVSMAGSARPPQGEPCWATHVGLTYLVPPVVGCCLAFGLHCHQG